MKLPLDLRSLAALNLVSTLAQIGQFGLGSTLLPLALQARGASAWQIGLASSALWLGMLAGLLVAGRCVHWWGYRLTVVVGVSLSALAFALAPSLPWALWSLPAAGVGFGLGLRWIANETWLYRLAPVQAQGRIVGIHESLIGLASVAGPMLVVALGAERPDGFYWAAGLTALAIPPLWLARTLAASDKDTPPEQQLATPGRLTQLKLALLGISLGAWVAGLGGWIEGSLLSLLPVLAGDQGLSSSQSAWLLTLIGVGATSCQFPIGWLADHLGVRRTALGLASTVLVCTLLAWGLPAQWGLAIMAFGVGATTGGMLTLGMVHAAQGAGGAAITARVRQVSVVYTLLSACGPLVAGVVLSQTGNSQSLLGLQLATTLVLLAVLRRAPAQAAVTH